MPHSRVFTVRHSSSTLFALVLAAIGWPSIVSAQSGQEKLIQQRLERAGTLEYEPAGKAFSTNAAVGSRQAAVRSFAFGGRAAGTKTGDGSFHAKSFDGGRGGFRTENFAVRRAAAADRQALPQADRTFATSAVPVREDRAANKPASTRQYVDSSKPYLVPGKRQDTIDELRAEKNLTIDQVRELLNKSR